MKKTNGITIIVFVSIIIAIIVYYIIELPKLYNDSLGHQRKTLQQLATHSKEKIQNDLLIFQSDLNYVLFSDNLKDVFEDSLEINETLKKLEFFYSKHEDLIDNINIYDKNRRFINLFKGDDDKFITDYSPAHRQKQMVDSIAIKPNKEKYDYYIPAFDGNELVGNIKVTIDLEHFVLAVLEDYYLKNNIWQWIIDLETKEVSTNIYKPDSLEIENIDGIVENLHQDYGDYLVHTIEINGKKQKTITYYTPLQFRDKRFGIAFSQNFDFIISNIYHKLILIIVPPVALLILLVIFLFYLNYSKAKHLEKDTGTTSLLSEFLELIPVGLAIIDANNKVITINQMAREILMVKDKSDITASGIPGKFLLNKKYTRNGLSKTSAYDTDQFVLYQKEGNEIVLFKKEISCFIQNMEYTLSAFVDVTTIEKSRKYEEAANTAKSEFLAKMSHEIRTPMNGIIGMTDALLHNKLTKEQKEYVEVIKRSADLLLNIVDDILDYSKIEAGKMQLEEIPFNLREEIRISLDLFKLIIEEKGIKLTSSFDKSVPENLIGDPFRLRQVLSNLISNAVKFTHEGEIRVTADVEEEYSGNLTLRISVIDTGVGIPKNRLNTIFNSFTQADYSTSRKYGGSGLGTTISKQLVNLMNGEIWVDSPSGISRNKKYPGSKFTFTFEVFSNEKLDKKIDFSDIKGFSDINALIITQNQNTKKRLFGFLEHYGIHVEVARFEEEIINDIKKYLTSADKKYHVVFIMDEPNFDGLWIGKELHKAEITDHHIICMISSNHKQENYLQTKATGIDYYLTQPFEQTLLKSYFIDCIPGISFGEEIAQDKIRQNLSILVAEDNILNQKVATTIFEHLGLKIDIANNGKEVIEMIKNKSYDVVFMDLMMPDKDGIDTTVEIRGLGYQMPIIAMTATASKIGKTNAISSGMNDYITKPINMGMVKDVLHKWFS